MNADGTLNITSKNVFRWRGIRWDQDASKYTPGSTISVSCADLPENCEIILRFNDDSSETGTLVYPAREPYKPSGTVPATVNSVFMAIRRTNSIGFMSGENVKPMVSVGEGLPFEKPDVTDWGGATYELANLWPYWPDKATNNRGVSLSRAGDVITLSGTATVSPPMLVAEADDIHLDAGTYRIEAPLPALLLVSVNGSTTRLLRTDSEPMTATLNAGDYRFSIYTKDKTTNMSFTPRLTRDE